jgi:hypothetical protein
MWVSHRGHLHIVCIINRCVFFNLHIVCIIINWPISTMWRHPIYRYKLQRQLYYNLKFSFWRLIIVYQFNSNINIQKQKKKSKSYKTTNCYSGDKWFPLFESYSDSGGRKMYEYNCCLHAYCNLVHVQVIYSLLWKKTFFNFISIHMVILMLTKKIWWFW